MLTPAQINNKQFRVVRLGSGYDQTEVDDFIDVIYSDYKFLHHCWEQVQDRKGRHTPSQGVTQVIPPMPAQQPSEMIAKVLAVAEETAEKHIHEGKVTAEQLRLSAQDDGEKIISAATRDGAQMLDNARKQAEEIVSQASGERHRIIGELEERRVHLKERVDELARVEQEVTARMRKALEGWND